LISKFLIIIEEGNVNTSAVQEIINISIDFPGCFGEVEKGDSLGDMVILKDERVLLFQNNSLHLFRNVDAVANELDNNVFTSIIISQELFNLF